MITSINDEIRNKFNKSIFSIIFRIEKLDDETKNQLIRLFLADFYKIKLFESLETNDYDFINKFRKPIDDLVDECLFDQELLYNVIECSFIFNNIPSLSKITIMETIESTKQDYIIFNISKLHILDKITYSFRYDLEYFKGYYIDYKNKNENSSYVSTLLADRLLEYKKKNNNEFSKFILEFIKLYYKWNIFVKENIGIENLNKEDIIYLDMIKFSDIDALIKYIGEDINFLITIIDNYLYYSTTEKFISEDIVNEYFYNNVDEDTRKKLKLKRD